MAANTTKSSSLLKTTPGIFNLSKVASPVKFKIGDADHTLYLLTGLEGSQPFRTQIDVALDETTYAIGAGKAMGSQTFGLIDGPFQCTQKVESVLSKLRKMKNLNSRKVEITLPSYAQFTGIISNFNIKLDDSLVEGSYYILVTVTAMGVWK